MWPSAAEESSPPADMKEAKQCTNLIEDLRMLSFGYHAPSKGTNFSVVSVCFGPRCGLREVGVEGADKSRHIGKPDGLI